MSIYQNPWFFRGQPFEETDIGKFAGFVYLIINRKTNKKYIGKKFFWSKRKGKRRTMSDWKNYYGSSETLLEDVKKLGEKNFERIILSLHRTRGCVNFHETKEQFLRNVLQNEEYYNHNIGKYINVRLDESEYSLESECQPN